MGQYIDIQLFLPNTRQLTPRGCRLLAKKLIQAADEKEVDTRRRKYNYHKLQSKDSTRGVHTAFTCGVPGCDGTEYWFEHISGWVCDACNYFSKDEGIP